MSHRMQRGRDRIWGYEFRRVILAPFARYSRLGTTFRTASDVDLHILIAYTLVIGVEKYVSVVSAGLQLARQTGPPPGPEELRSCGLLSFLTGFFHANLKSRRAQTVADACPPCLRRLRYRLGYPSRRRALAEVLTPELEDSPVQCSCGHLQIVFAVSQALSLGVKRIPMTHDIVMGVVNPNNHSQRTTCVPPANAARTSCLEDSIINLTYALCQRIRTWDISPVK
jgi:hypothetical protein